MQSGVGLQVRGRAESTHTVCLSGDLSSRRLLRHFTVQPSFPNSKPAEPEQARAPSRSALRVSLLLPHQVSSNTVWLAAESHLPCEFVTTACPPRRAFLSGRFPNSITSVQPDGANLCSDFLPLACTILSEKLASVGYVGHFVGKGHVSPAATCVLHFLCVPC